jgi:RNA polymerase sigma-70 factor, ECF subfamily
VSASVRGRTAADEIEVSVLIEKSRAGSISSLGTLLEIFRPDLSVRAESDLNVEMRSRMSMSDLVQETMLTACSRFREFRGTTCQELEAWLIRILKSRLIDGIRRHQIAEIRRQGQEHKAVGLDEIADGGLSPSGLLILEEEAVLLLEAVRKLPEEFQQLIHMRYVENETFETIAMQLNVPLSTVWRRFRESTLALHQCLKQ